MTSDPWRATRFKTREAAVLKFAMIGTGTIAALGIPNDLRPVEHGFSPPAPADDANRESASEAMRGVRGCADMTPFFGAKHERGLYGKFRVERTDGKSAPGQKHDGCRYFVLDLDHDTLAPPAIRAYAKAAREAGYVPLADDLDALYAAPLPATDDAVDEGLRAFYEAAKDYYATHDGVETAGAGLNRVRRFMDACAALYAALRGKGGA